MTTTLWITAVGCAVWAGVLSVVAATTMLEKDGAPSRTEIVRTWLMAVATFFTLAVIAFGAVYMVFGGG